MTLRRIVPALAAATAAAAVAYAAAQPAPGSRAAPFLRPLVSPIRATEVFRWPLPFSVHNATGSGLYLDSLVVTVENLDPGERRSPRIRSFPAGLETVLDAISPGDSHVVNFSFPATAEHARIVLRLASRSAAGESFVSEAVVEALPGIVSSAHPSAFLEDRRRVVEYVVVPRGLGETLSPGVLLIHDEGSDARVWIPLARDLSTLGYTTMMVSLPGYGRSSGPPDFAGPAAIRAAGLALDRLKRHPQVDSTRIGLWGLSQGATVAALLAARRPELKAVVLQGGIYDLAATIRETDSEILRGLLVGEAGPPGGWAKRSPLPARAVFRAPALILHSLHDRSVPAEQVRRYVALLEQAGGEVTVSMLPGTLHLLSPATVQEAVQEFLGTRLGPVP